MSLPELMFGEGSGGATPCHQDERTFLLQKSFVYRHGTAEHQPLRAHQGERLRWVLDDTHSPLHEPDAPIIGSHATPQNRALRPQA